jgi:hypothetical protein
MSWNHIQLSVVLSFYLTGNDENNFAISFGNTRTIPILSWTRFSLSLWMRGPPFRMKFKGTTLI